MCCNCCSVLQQKIWVITIGILCVLGGVLLITLWPGATESIVNNLLPLKPDSWMFKKWLNPPIQSYMFIYLFNWTNMHEATNHNVKPNFSQHGPYVFREDRSKDDIIWHDNDTMTYYNRRTWFFEKEMSGGSLDDVIILPHPPTVVATKLVKNTNRYAKKIMNYALKTEGGLLGVNKTAEEWLFKGFHDPLTEFAGLFLTEIVSFNLDKFGLIYGRNASKTYEGTYTIHTGQKDLSMLGDLVEWRGSNQSHAYNGECGRINGSTGDIFSPKIPPGEIISVFIPDTCRSINLYPGETMNHRGIETVRYSTSNMSLDSGELNDDNKCFCSEKSNKCAPTGAIDLGPCLYGAPMYMSQPHFLNADPSYAAAITGMAPNPKEHEFYLIVEPRLGVPLSGNANMQINMLLEPDDSIEIFNNINEFYAPLIILSDQVDLNESFARLIRLFFKSAAIGVGCGIALLVLGIIFLLLAIFLTCTHRWRGEKQTFTKNQS